LARLLRVRARVRVRVRARARLRARARARARAGVRARVRVRARARVRVRVMARLLHGGHGLFGRPLYGDRHRPRLPDHHGDVGVEGEAAQARRHLKSAHVAVRG